MHTKMFIEILKHTNLLRFVASLASRNLKAIRSPKMTDGIFARSHGLSNFAIAFHGYPAGLVFGGDTRIDSPENQLNSPQQTFQAGLRGCSNLNLPLGIQSPSENGNGT